MNAENSPRLHESSTPTQITNSGGAVMQPVVPGKPPAAAAQASNVLVGPLKGAAGSRDNRDMSEGLEKSRSHKLGALV